MPKILFITNTANASINFLPQAVPLAPSTELFKQINDLQAEFIILQPEMLLTLLNNPHMLINPEIIVTKTHTGLKHVALAEIQYFLADQKYVLVYYKNGELLLNESLNSLEYKYRHSVLRVHRNTLVNIHWIDELINEDDKYYVTIKGTQTRLSVSRRQLPAVRKYMKCGKLE